KEEGTLNPQEALRSGHWRSVKASRGLGVESPCVTWSELCCCSGVHKPPGYCWPTYFKVLGVLFLGEVSPAFLPSRQARRTHKFRHFRVRQQYPPVFWTFSKLLLLEAGARHERTLAAVACTPWFGLPVSVCHS